MTLRIIAGKYKGRFLQTPKVTSTRPTQGMLREAVFNICQMHIEGARMLDLYAGSGAMGLEALSRGASHCTFVESKREAIACIHKNIHELDVAKETTVISINAERALKQLSGPFDLVYIDPPYNVPIAPILDLLLSKQILNPGAILFLEERYNPKEKAKVYTSLQLELKSSRRFGPAWLHEYEKRL